MNNTNLSLPLNQNCLDMFAAQNAQLTEAQVLREESSWLKIGHPLACIKDVSFKFLSLIAGDAFIGNTKYEGGYHCDSISFFLDFFNQLKGKDAQPEILTLLENAQHIDGLMNGDISSFRKNISKYIKKEGVTWYPCGWSDRINSAHAIIMEIDTKSNSVTFFNAGDGLQFHGRSLLGSIDPTGQHNSSRSDQCFLKMTHCDPSKLNSPQFYQYLYEMHNKHETDPNIELNADLLYKGIKKFLKGTFEKKNDPEKNPTLYKKPQRSGTCGVKSLLAAIYYKLQDQKNGIAKYKRLKFLWQSRALVSVTNQGIEPKEKYLVENIVENMARATDKEPLKKELSDEEKTQWEATLLDIQSKLSEVADHSFVPSDNRAEDVRTISLPVLPIYPLKLKQNGTPSKSLYKDFDSHIQCFKAEKTQVQFDSELSIVESTAKLKELALTLKEHPENIGQIYALYARIVELARNDPKSKLKNYSINIDPIEDHIRDPKAVYINPETHNSLQGSVEYLRGLGKENQLFKLEEGRIVISGKSLKSDPTMKYFRQFLKENGSKTRLQNMQDLLTGQGTQHLPESVRCLYEAWYYSTAVLRSHEENIDFTPSRYTIKASNPTKLAVDFSFLEKNISLPDFFKEHPYQDFISSELKQNHIVSGADLPKKFSPDPIINRNMHMIGLDAIDIPNRLIAFFSKNMDLFAKDGTCSYMLSQLFRPFLLLDQIKAQPLYLPKLIEFCEDAINHFIQLGEYDRAMNCILMTHQISTFLKGAGFEADFPQLRSKIIDEMIPKIVEAGKSQECAALFEVLLKDISIEEQNPHYDADLASYMFISKRGNFPIDESLKEKYEERVDQIQKKDAEDDTFKKQVLRCLGLPEGDYVVGYSNFVVCNEDQTMLVEQPQKVTSHPFYKSYFKNCEVKSTEIEGDKNIISLSSGTKEIILKKTVSGFHFFKIFDGRLFEYIHSESDESKLVNIPGTLWKDTLIGGQYDNFYLLDEKTDQPCIQFLYRNKTLSEVMRFSDGARLQSNCPMPEQKENIGVVKRNSVNEEFSNLNAFEEELLSLVSSHIKPKPQIAKEIENIWVIEKENGKGEVKEFSYFNLKFSQKYVEHKNRLYCEQYPGYFLINNQLDEKINQPYVTLSNMAGQQIVLIENEVEKASYTMQLVECSVVNGTLVGTSLDDKLFLIKHYLEQHEHVLAYNLVKELNCLEPIQDDKDLSRWERTNLKSIFEFLRHKRHPNEQAIYLHLVKLELENRMKFPAKINLNENFELYKKEEVEKIFIQYFLNETNCTICRLTPKDKLNLSMLLKESYDISIECKEWCGRVIIPNIPQIKEEKHDPFWSNNQYFQPHGLVFSPEYFNKNYQNLYKIATSGNLKEKKWLGDVLDFNYGYHTRISSYTSIYNKYRWPYMPYIVESIYRSHSYFFNMAVRLSEIAIKQLWVKRIHHQMPLKSLLISPSFNIDVDSMKGADQVFDTYFKDLIGKYFVVKDIPQEVFDDKLPSEDPSELVEAKLILENKDLQYFRDHILKPTQEIELDNLLGLKKELKKTTEEVSSQLKTMKAALLWQINSGDLFKKMGYRRKLEWKDLQKLSLTADFALFAKETALDQKSAEKVLSLVGYYLVLESRVNQMSNVLKDLKDATDPKANNIKKKLLIHQAFEKINVFTSEVREYTQVDRLWFECTNKYLYRKNQMDKLNEILDAHQEFREIQAEMPTGYGKTKLIVPTLTEALSKGKAIVNCWPATLEMTNLRDMASQMKNSFGRGIDRLTFDRASNFTAANLAAIYRALLDDKENRRPINCCPEAIRALELHFLLTLDSHPIDNNKLKYFIKILSFLRNDAWATIDEEHVLLNPMDRLIYTLGDAVPLPDRDINLVEKLVHLLFLEPIKSQVDRLKNGDILKFESRYQKIAQALAKQFTQDLECATFEEEFTSFVTGIQEKEPDWLGKHPKKEEIALLKGVLCFILNPSLKGSVDEKFGLSKKHFDTIEFAISYSSANTPNETDSGPSQYKNPHETLVKTYLTYLVKGLQRDQVKNLITDLQYKVQLEMAQGIPIPKTEAYQIYQSFKVSSKKPLFELEPADIEEITDELVKNKLAIFNYIKLKVAPQIKIYEESISSDAQNFRSQFASSLSLSATPQNQAAHGPETQFLPMKGTSGQVTHLLMTKCNKENSIHEMNSTTSEQAAEEVTGMLKGREEIKAVIDIGAQFKGLSNYEIAMKLIADSDPDVKGVLFFDEKEGVFKIVDKASNTIVDFSSTDISSDERRTLYDQSRCFGSDLQQSCHAVALLLTSKQNTKAEIGQGVGRMRQLHKGQSVEIGVPAEMSEQKNIKDLLVYWITNQEEKEALLKYLSQLQQYDNLLRRELLDTMLNAGENLSAIKSIFRKNRKLFITREAFSPYLQYARASKSLAAVKALEEKKNSVIAHIKTAAHLTSRQKNALVQQLNTQANKEILLPKTVPGDSNIGMECEVLQEVEVELEIEGQNLVKNKVVFREPIQWNEKLNLFKKGWEGSGKLYPVFKRSIGYLMGRLPGTILDETIILTKRIQSTKEKILQAIALTVLTPIIGTISAIALIALDSIKTTFWLFNIFLEALMCIPASVLPLCILAETTSAAFLAAQSVNFLVKKITIYIAKKFHTDNYICRVDEIMKMHLKSHRECHKMFSPDFFATNNFYKQSSCSIDLRYGGIEIIAPQPPLSIDQKPIFEIMLIEDTGWFGRKHLKAVAIDKNDSIFFRKKLQEDIKTKISNAAKRSRKVAIYDPVNEIIVAQGKNEFSMEDLDKRPEFHELLASAKFLNGEIHYTPNELDYLERKIKLIGKKSVRNFFFNQILTPFRPKNLNYLKSQKGSKLRQLLA